MKYSLLSPPLLAAAFLLAGSIPVIARQLLPRSTTVAQDASGFVEAVD